MEEIRHLRPQNQDPNGRAARTVGRKGKKKAAPKGGWLRSSGGYLQATVLTVIPLLFHALHERHTAFRLSRGRFARAHSPCGSSSRRAAGEQNSGKHDDKAHQPKNDDLGHDPTNHQSDTRERQERAECDEAIVSATRSGRDDISVAAIEIALHLIEQSLLMLRQWHASLRVVKKWMDYQGKCTPARRG